MRLFIFIFILILILIFTFIFQVMNIFVNLFGREAKISVQDRKSNLRTCRLTGRARYYPFHFISFHFISFHLDFTWKEGTKIGDSSHKSAACGGQPLPDSLGNSQCFLSITFLVSVWVRARFSRTKRKDLVSFDWERSQFLHLLKSQVPGGKKTNLMRTNSWDIVI
jgi:hypothetical protein